MTESFVPPRGVTGYNIDETAAQRRDRAEQFHAWGRALANADGQRATPQESQGNYDVLRFDGAELWLVHSHHVALVGALNQAPEAGFAFAIQCAFVDIDVPDHLATWGPQVVPAEELNRQLRDSDWANFSPPARAHADRFKPTHLGHLVFNHWD